MLNTSSFKKKKQIQKDDYFSEGVSFIEGNLYKQATKSFIKALQEDKIAVTQKLNHSFHRTLQSSGFEPALAIGEALLKVYGQNSAFLVNLGNCYRHISEYQKANDLYRKALRVNKSNTLALYNLAASLAKVNWFDLEIKKKLEQFRTMDRVVLPPYLNDPDIVDTIMGQLEKERREKHELIEALQEQREQELQSGNKEAVKEIISKIEAAERNLATPAYQVICQKLRKAIKTNWARQTIEESRIILQENRYNLGLYALSQNDLALAEDSFQKLKAEGSRIEHLDLLLGLMLELEGKSGQAIEKLTEILKRNPCNRYATVNLGILYRKKGNRLLSMRYLLKAADMLEKSDGLYSLPEIERRADEYFDNEDYTHAFRLFTIVTNESPGAKAWNKIGEIHIIKGELVEATMAFHEALELESANETAQKKLLEIHDIYTMKADTHFRNGFYIEAIAFYQNALELHKSVDLMTKLIRGYEKLNDFAQVNTLKSEIEKLKQKAQKERLEEQRQALLTRGKALMREKKFEQSIEQLEKAFEMKADKDTFLLLAYIFKALNQSRKLSSLVQQWRTLMEREVKIRESQE